jgi:hypothetical protein
MIHQRPELDHRDALGSLIGAYSEFRLAPDTQIDLKRTESALAEVFGVITRKVEGRVAAMAIDAVLSFLDGLFAVNKPARSGSIMAKAVSFVSTMTKPSGYQGNALVLSALLYGYCETKKIASDLKKFWMKWFEAKTVTVQNARVVLCVFVACLKAGDPEIASAEHQGKMVACVVAEPKLFSPYPTELMTFMLALAARDSQVFLARTFQKFMEPKFASVNMSAFVLLCVELSDPNSTFEYDSATQSGVLTLLEAAFDSAMQEGISQSPDASRAFHVRPFLPIFRANELNPSQSILGLMEDCDPVSFSVASEVTNRLLIQKWSKLLGDTSALVFRSGEGSLRVYSTSPNENPLLCRALSVVPLFAPNRRFAASLISLLFSGHTHVAALAHRILELYFVRNEAGRVSLVTTLLGKMWKSVSLTAEHIYTLLYYLEQLFEVALGLAIPFQSSLAVELTLIVIAGLCSDSGPVRELALGCAALYHKLTGEYTLADLAEEFADAIELRAKRAALLSVSDDPELDTFPTLKFRDVLKSGLNNLYSFYLAEFASACLERQKELQLAAVHARMITIVSTLAAERMSACMYTNYVTFLFNSARGDIVRPDQMSAVCRVVMASGRLTSSHALLTALHQELVETIYPIALENKAFVQAIAFSIRTTPDALTDVSFRFATLTGIIQGQKKRSLESPIVRDALLAGGRLFEIVFAPLARFPAGPYVRRKIVHDCPGIFDSKLWYDFVLSFEPSPLTNRTLVALIELAPPPPVVYDGLQNSSPEVRGALLARRPGLLLRFIEGARDSRGKPAQWFAPIVSQFVSGDPAALMSQWMANLTLPMTERDVDFTQTVYSQTGALLALAFAYICRETGSLRIQGYELLRAVATGSAAYFGKASSAVRIFTKLTELIFAITSQLTNLYVSALVSISSLLAPELDFCTEQFISGMLVALRLANGAPLRRLMQVLIPWVDGASLTPDGFPVFPQTHPSFRCLSFYSLVRNLASIATTAERLIVFDKLTASSSDSTSFGFVTRALCDLYQNGGDAGEVNLCMAHLAHQRPAAAAVILTHFLRAEYQIGADPAAYTRAVAFASRGMYYAILARHDAVADFDAICFAHAIVTLGEGGSLVLGALLPELDSPGVDNESLLLGEFLGRGPAFQAVFGRQCLEWGLWCGNLAWAIRGLSIYRKFATPISDDVRLRLRSNIRIATRLASEKQTGTLLSYVSHCWETARLIGDRDPELLQLCLESLAFAGPDILSTLFPLVAEFITAGSFGEVETKLVSQRMAKPLRLARVDGFFSVLIAAARNGIAVLGTQEALVVVLLLAFGVCGEGEDSGFFAKMLQDSEVGATLAWLAETRDDVVEFETALQIAQGMSDESITVVLNILGALAAAGALRQCKYVYAFAVVLVTSGRCQECFAHFLECAEDDQSFAYRRNSFIEMIDGQKARAAMEAFKEGFPKVDITKDLVVRDQVRTDGDLTDFPPLFVRDSEFEECETVKMVAKAWEGLLIEPIATWNTEIEMAKRPVPAIETKAESRFNSEEVYEAIHSGLSAVEGNPGAPLHVVGGLRT